MPETSKIGPMDVVGLESIRQSRLMVWTALWLALGGTLFGLTFGRSIGAIAGMETLLLVASLVFCGTLIVVLWVSPFDRTPWVAPTVSVFFYGYLIGGGLISLLQTESLANLMVYQLWFFPLLAFNRFVNTSRFQSVITWLMYLSALALAAVSIPLLDAPNTFLAPLTVYCLALTSFLVILGLFARYREAYIASQERAQAQEATHRAIRASEAQFRQIFDQAASGIGWLSPDGICEYVNTTFGQMLNESPDQLKTRPLAALVCEDDRDKWHTALAEALQGDHQNAHSELRLVSSHGKMLWTRISLARLNDTAGQPKALVLICLDITEARETEEQLRQSQRLEAVGRLTGGVAHDFNNLLTVIMGNAELLAEILEKEPDHQALATMILEASQRGAELTNHLLAFSRKQSLTPQFIDVNRLVQGMSALLQRTLGDHVQIRLLLDERLWTTEADPTQLESALLNLCINARDAMPGGGVLTITTSKVTVRQSEPEHAAHVMPGDYVMLAVSDSGHGIPEEHLDRIFEPFYTTKPLGQGTGLGLAMTWGFVKQTGGHISVHSAAGVGTTLKLYLPRTAKASVELT